MCGENLFIHVIYQHPFVYRENYENAPPSFRNEQNCPSSENHTFLNTLQAKLYYYNAITTNLDQCTPNLTTKMTCALNIITKEVNST